MSNDLRSNFNDDLQFMKHHRSLSGKQPGESINMQDIDMIYNRSSDGEPLLMIERKYANDQPEELMRWQLWCDHVIAHKMDIPFFLMFYKPNKISIPSGPVDFNNSLQVNRNYSYVLIPFNKQAEQHYPKYHRVCLSDDLFSTFLHKTFGKQRPRDCQPSKTIQRFRTPPWIQDDFRVILARGNFKAKE